MANRCAYCWELLGDTRDHVFPKMYSNCVGHHDGNIVPSCKWCNRAKDSKIYLPTISNIYGIFSNFTNKQLYFYASYCHYHFYTIWNKYLRFRADKDEIWEEWKQFDLLWYKEYFYEMVRRRVDRELEERILKEVKLYD